MSRRTVFSLLAALAVCALAVVAALAMAPSAPPAADDKAVADAIDSTLKKVFRDNASCAVRIESSDDLGKLAGTGFFADAEGTIYTLSSLVGDGLSVTVTHQGQEFPAKVLANDSRSGVAIIKIEAGRPTPFPVNASDSGVEPGSPVIVIGFPFEHEATPSFGVVGGLDRKSKGRFFATTHFRASVPVQRGEGGSPVFNLHGEAVGILVSSLSEGSGCYVLPMRAAEKVRGDYARFGEVRHGWAGVTLQEIREPVHGSRMAIDVIDPGGPAAAAGFKAGDVVLKVGDISVRDPEDALDASFFLTAGDTVPVTVARGKEILEMPFTPGEHPLAHKDGLQALGSGSGLSALPSPPGP